MSKINLSDTEIEILLLGKWRFETDWEKISIQFKDDMTYEQSRIQTFILSKPRELITGNKFFGIWHVNDRRLYFTLRSLPKSIFNFQIPILSKVYLADMAASLISLFITEKYEIIQINSSKFVIQDMDKSFVAIKIN